MSENQSRALARTQVMAGGQVSAIVPQSLDEAWRLSQYFAESGMTPKGIDTPAKVLMVVAGGAEVGFGPFQSLQSFAVINGRLGMWGDALPALLWSHGFKLREWTTDESADFPGKMTAHCEVTRPDGDVIERTFSVADAKRASLWGKQGPWVQYPARMLQMRARGFAARDGAPDVLRGIAIREEVEDIELAAEVVEGTNRPQELKADGPREAPPEIDAEVEPDLEEVLDGDDLPEDEEAAEEPQEAEEDAEATDLPEDEPEDVTEPPQAQESDDGEDFPPEMRAFIDKVEDSSTFGEVKAALQEFFATPTFREMNVTQQNHIRRTTWETIADKKAEGQMADLPDHAQDVSAFRLWIEAQRDPDAIRGTFDVLKRTANYAGKDITFKRGFEATVENRLGTL